MRIYAPVLTAVTLGLSVLSMLQAEDSFLWAWTALMIASFPAGMFLSFSRPFAAQARRLSRAGAAVGVVVALLVLACYLIMNRVFKEEALEY